MYNIKLTNFDKCSRKFDTNFDIVTYTLGNTNHLNSDLSICYQSNPQIMPVWEFKDDGCLNL